MPLALFAVEALTNVFKHAYPAAGRGGRIAVTLKWASNELRLAVEDNGVGFRSIGKWRVQHRRAIDRTFGQQVGGAVFTQSTPGRGASVELRFPEPATGEQDDARRFRD